MHAQPVANACKNNPNSWGVVAKWIRHLLMAPMEGIFLKTPEKSFTKGGGGNNLKIYKCMFCYVHLKKQSSDWGKP